jgi:hypothetical protein
MSQELEGHDGLFEHDRVNAIQGLGMLAQPLNLKALRVNHLGTHSQLSADFQEIVT